MTEAQLRATDVAHTADGKSCVACGEVVIRNPFSDSLSEGQLPPGWIAVRPAHLLHVSSAPCVSSVAGTREF